MTVEIAVTVAGNETDGDQIDWWRLPDGVVLASTTGFKRSYGGRLFLTGECPAEVAREAVEAYLAARDGVWPVPTHTVAFPYGKKVFTPLLDRCLTDGPEIDEKSRDGAAEMLDFELEESK